jgi:anti-sigma regulatory factor (Ser/Thr protein kinase)
LVRSGLNFVEVIPNANLFSELGNNTYEFVDLLSELIDNAIAARSDETLNVRISIGFSEKAVRTYLIIKDNAKGIPFEKLGAALSPGAPCGKASLNEHGLGMKQAIASMGKLEYILTKPLSSKKAYKISRLNWGKVPVDEVQLDWKSGTEIRINDINPIVDTSRINYTRTYVPLLGARYRRYLRPSNKLMDLKIALIDVDNEDEENSWDVTEVKPIYFHPSTRHNAPVVERKKFVGKDWDAELTFGYAPSDKEFDELGLTKPGKFDPYYVSLSRQGLDLISNDRVIEFHQLSELELVAVRHPDLNWIRGEIDLKQGFKTAITKNAVMYDDHYKEMLQQIKDFLEKKELLKRRTWPQEIPESVLRDRLAHHLKSRSVDPKKNVVKEHAVGGLGGFVDVLADGEPYEIKTTKADGIDIYQLFAYMDMGKFDKGIFLAPEYATGAEEASKFIELNHSKKIVLAKLDEFPILHPLQANEL